MGVRSRSTTSILYGNEGASGDACIGADGGSFWLVLLYINSDGNSGNWSLGKQSTTSLSVLPCGILDPLEDTHVPSSQVKWYWRDWDANDTWCSSNESCRGTTKDLQSISHSMKAWLIHASLIDVGLKSSPKCIITANDSAVDSHGKNWGLI